MERQNTKWLVNFAGGEFVPDMEFSSLEDALFYVGDNYFEEPSKANIDNAQCCISAGKITFVAFRCITCKMRKEHDHIHQICIGSKAAFEQWQMDALEGHQLS